MDTHDSVAAMASAYAEKAVVMGREFKANLDYSENSLMEVETILAQLPQEMPGSKPATEDAAEICKMWASYLGEVARLRFGGECGMETYPAKQFAPLTR